MSVALLVVDAQRIYTDPSSELRCPDVEATLERINALIAQFEAAGAPTVFVRHLHRTDGSDLGRMFDFSGEAVENFQFREGSAEVEYIPGLRLPENRLELTKTRYSAFQGTQLSLLLQKRRVRRVAICGFMTNFCCESTARSAHDLDYFVDFCADATGTPGLPGLDQNQLRSIVGDMLAAGFAQVFAASDYLRSLGGRSVATSAGGS